MPRPYTLGKRGESQAETRRRIIEATLGLYREVGIGGATVAAIARAADVAPATVRNHFPGANDLADAAADAILAGLGMPDASIFAETRGPIERIERLLVETAAFFERSSEWWAIRQADRGLGNAWAVSEAHYDERMAALIRLAVEPLGDEPAVGAIIGAVLVHVYFAARSAGLSTVDAVAVERALLVPWLEARMAAP
ncbi:MAG TPA: TetR family transcriptional regulator [Patescibacteria group bacterium]|nr:TetR family transcriptional regulator [Patescibacteria group bacterium]